MRRPPLKILLAAPRGFCAGVIRAIEVVEQAIRRYGAPVYVRHEIVHNKYVVEDLKRKGAIFVDELDEIPDGDRPVIFSAHGVPRSVSENARRRNLLQIDATCPLVTKVHMEARRQFDAGNEIALIGHRDHPEVVGTMGQLPANAVRLIETREDAEVFVPVNPEKLAYTTQTTLSVDDTREIVEVLQRRFPKLAGPPRDDICYATTNRQLAVKSIAPLCDALIVVGAPNSSNARRLVETARRAGCKTALLVQEAGELDMVALQNLHTLGVTAGASAPEVLVDQVLDAFRRCYDAEVETVLTRAENVSFKLPRQLRGETSQEFRRSA